MKILGLDALAAAPLQTDPCEYIIVPHFVRPEALDEVNRDFPEIAEPGNFKPSELRYGPAFETLISELHSLAASHNILDRGRCNSNAPEVVYPTHTPHPTARFFFIRFSRADSRASASLLGTSSPMPKNTSSGVCPSNAEMGHHFVVGFDVELGEATKRGEGI